MIPRASEDIAILEQVSEPCEILKEEAAARLTQVKGEFEDEDGDWATDFILADPKPVEEAALFSYSCSLAGTGRHCQMGLGDPDEYSLIDSSDSNCDDWFSYSNVKENGGLMMNACRKSPYYDDDSESSCGSFGSGDLAIFPCQVCKNQLPLELLWPELKCNCLCCKACLQQHAESCLEHEINERRSTSADASSSVVVNRSGPDNAAVSEVVPLRKMSFDCPACSCADSISLSAAQLLAPEVFTKWQEAANQVLFETAAFMSCPGCTVMIEKVTSDLSPGVSATEVPELDQTVPQTELDDEGKPLSQAALFHKVKNYFCCALCKVGFCGLCMANPYHLGKTCEQFEEEKNAVKCLYCEAPIFTQKSVDNRTEFGFVKGLKKDSDNQVVDASHYVEKSDLAGVQWFSLMVCDMKECRERLSQACTRRLECGHHCGGVEGEQQCLPCLKDDCRQNTVSCSGGNSLPSADDLCSICLVEPLRCAPSIQLTCGHVVHLNCAKNKIKEGFPGPEISFGYLNCPQCPQLMQHIALVHDMQKPLQLMSMVKENALSRLKMEEVPSFVMQEDLETYAQHEYLYYTCSKCNKPYFGGKRDCILGSQAHENENLHNPRDLVCGGCSAAMGMHGICKKGHGKEYIEFKCRYCCSVATYFCYGHIHFCNRCHQLRRDADLSFVPKKCKGPELCPLHVPHAPNGKEFCLGCAMCRLLSQ